MKNYLIDTDPTLSKMRMAIIIMWAVTFALIIAIFMQPNIKPWLSPIVRETNGAIFNSDYIPAEIK